MSLTGNDKIVIPSCCEIYLQEGIVRVSYDDGAEVNTSMKKQMHEAYLQITQGVKMPFLFSNKGAFWIEKGARDFARKIEPKQPFSAVAYWAPTLGIRLMAEFYGKFYKPEIPYKVFAVESDAIAWLSGLKA